MKWWFSRSIIFSQGKGNSCGVAIGYLGRKFFEPLNKFNNKSGCVLIIEVKIENDLLLLINLYNAKSENEQVSPLFDLRKKSLMWEKIIIIIIFNNNNKSTASGGTLIWYWSQIRSSERKPYNEETV